MAISLETLIRITEMTLTYVILLLNGLFGGGQPEKEVLQGGMIYSRIVI
jgi:hypothetical protein